MNSDALDKHFKRIRICSAHTIPTITSSQQQSVAIVTSIAEAVAVAVIKGLFNNILKTYVLFVIVVVIFLVYVPIHTFIFNLTAHTSFVCRRHYNYKLQHSSLSLSSLSFLLFYSFCQSLSICKMTLCLPLGLNNHSSVFS